MICDRLLGNLQDATFQISEAACERDELLLTWQQCTRRFLRKKTNAGRDIGLLLPAGCRLRHGDVLHAEAGLIISVAVIPAEVLVVEAANVEDLAIIAYTLGDLHIPLEVAIGSVIVPADEATQAMLRRLGYSFSPDLRRFHPLASSVTGIVTVASDLRLTVAKSI